jgi:hypothetical protein
MRIIRDNAYVSSQKRRAKYSAILGFLALIGTFPVAFLMQGNTGFVLMTYFLLLGGFILFNRGMRGVGRWSHNARHAREDMALDQQLNDLSDRYTLIHYAGVDGGMVQHLLVGPSGVVVLSTTDFPGQAVAQDDNWRRSGPMLTRMFTFSGPQLGNPSREADRQFELVERVLDQANVDVDIYTAIVFTASTADVTAEGTSHPVLMARDVNGYIRAMEPDPLFTTAERERVVSMFAKSGEVQNVAKGSTRRPVKVKKRAA